MKVIQDTLDIKILKRIPVFFEKIDCAFIKK